MKRTIIKLAILILFVCLASVKSNSQVNMDKFIEIKCEKGAKFKLNLAADSSNTKVIVKNGYISREMTIQTGLFYSPGYHSITFDTILRIYGDVTQIDFKGDGLYTIREINTDSNTYLTQMWLYSLGLEKIDLHKLHNLEFLHLFYCRLDSINVSNLKNLIYLDVSFNENLEKLDLRELTKLRGLYFQGSGISEINITGLKNLEAVYCYNNNLSTMGFDSLFCALPDRSGLEVSGRIVVIEDSIRSDYATYMASNAQNLITKSWFPTNRSYQDLPPTYGTFDCSSIGIEDIQLDILEAKIYPNPAKTDLNVEADDKIILVELFDMLGKRVLSQTANKKSINIDISSLKEGLYVLKLQTEKGIGSYKVVKN